MVLEGLELWNLWVVAGVVAGFQLGAFRWRIERELRMEDEGKTVWFPRTDWMLAGSFVGLLVFVFILPTFGNIPVECAARWLVVSMIPLGVYPFALIGHYQLFRERKGRISRDGFPLGEKIVLGVGLALVIAGATFAVWACWGDSLWMAGMAVRQSILA